MIATFTIGGVLFEISGTPEECRKFIGYAKTNSPRWWEHPDQVIYGKSIADMVLPKVCDPFKAHFGTCGAPNCPIGPDGKIKPEVKTEVDTSANPICPICNDTGKEFSYNSVDWHPGVRVDDRFRRDCSAGCK